jgi:hypothetical protein
VIAAVQKLAHVRREHVSDILRNASTQFVRRHKQGRWAPAAYDTPVKEKATMGRLTYAEWSDVEEYLRAVAREARIERSELIRQIVHTYIKSK